MHATKVYLYFLYLILGSAVPLLTEPKTTSITSHLPTASAPRLSSAQGNKTASGENPSRCTAKFLSLGIPPYNVPATLLLCWCRQGALPVPVPTPGCLVMFQHSGMDAGAAVLTADATAKRQQIAAICFGKTILNIYPRIALSCQLPS